jgi:ubiquinone biosynthesis monooxygenase Coq7
MTNTVDVWLIACDNALRTLSGTARASRPSPAAVEASELTDQQRRLAGALMRVNHVGEVCAQALYDAQGMATRSPALQSKLQQAGREETDHLAWTAERLEALGAHRSWLNPVWYGGAFALGLVAGRAGDGWSLGFVAETERQVEQHLASHLDRLPIEDHASRAIVAQMKTDEARHAEMACAEGALPLPAPLRWMMRGAAKLMTTTAHYV